MHAYNAQSRAEMAQIIDINNRPCLFNCITTLHHKTLRDNNNQEQINQATLSANLPLPLPPAPPARLTTLPET